MDTYYKFGLNMYRKRLQKFYTVRKYLFIYFYDWNIYCNMWLYWNSIHDNAEMSSPIIRPEIKCKKYEIGQKNFKKYRE